MNEESPYQYNGVNFHPRVGGVAITRKEMNTLRSYTESFRYQIDPTVSSATAIPKPVLGVGWSPACERARHGFPFDLYVAFGRAHYYETATILAGVEVIIDGDDGELHIHPYGEFGDRSDDILYFVNRIIDTIRNHHAPHDHQKVIAALRSQPKKAPKKVAKTNLWQRKFKGEGFGAWIHFRPDIEKAVVETGFTFTYKGRDYATLASAKLDAEKDIKKKC